MLPFASHARVSRRTLLCAASSLALAAVSPMLAGCGGGDGSQNPTPQPIVTNRLIFASTKPQASVYTLNPDTANASRLIDDATASSPRFSYNGAQVVYVSGSGVTRIKILTVGQSTVTVPLSTTTFPNLLHPAFSPNGTRIAFSNGTDIYSVNQDGTGLRQLTNMSAQSGADYPFYTSDGARIVFQRNLASGTTGSTTDIHIMNVDGTSQTNLTNSGKATQPSVSPVTGKIAYASLDTIGNEVYTMNLDGSGKTRITDGNTATTKYNPAFSPDGTRVAYLTTPNGTPIVPFVPDIRVVNVTGANDRLVSSGTYGPSSLDWR